MTFYQFKEHYTRLQANTTTKPPTTATKSKLSTLLRELSDEEDGQSDDEGFTVPNDPNRPWLRDFRSYIDTIENVPEGWTTIKWWGVCRTRVLSYFN